MSLNLLLEKFQALLVHAEAGNRVWFLCHSSYRAEEVANLFRRLMKRSVRPNLEFLSVMEATQPDCLVGIPGPLRIVEDNGLRLHISSGGCERLDALHLRVMALNDKRELDDVWFAAEPSRRRLEKRRRAAKRIVRRRFW